MIALSFGEQILQSWIYKPLTEEMCSAIQGEGTFLNEKKILIEKTSSLNLSKGSISSKYWDDNYSKRILEIKNSFGEVKSYGCIGFEYIDIANSTRQFAILSKLSPWDHLPGILIVREANGFDTYFDHGIYNHCLNKKNLIVACNGRLGGEILTLIKE
jgi:fructose-1,6-bisphosphatase/inositol monophosphatase family enzyme